MIDPLFVDRNNGDYHLSGNSPAIDYIDTIQRTNVNHPDIDYEARGFNDTNIFGTALFYHDVGADETLGSDIIFKDGFE